MVFKFFVHDDSSILGLVKGLNEVGKSLDRKEAVLCILAKDCDDTKYVKLVTELCKQNQIPLFEVDSKVDLGEWLGLCKYDKENKPRKVRATSSLSILDYGEKSQALEYLLNYIKNQE